MDIVEALESAGATATMTTSVRHALILAEHDGLSAAIMRERGIPYLSYSGYKPVEGASKDAQHIMKPVSIDTLMSAMEGLMAGPARVS